MNVVKTIPTNKVGLIDAVWYALSGNKVFFSATPVAFYAKAARFPVADKAHTAIICIDVLRATTTLTAVAAAGAAAIALAIKPKDGSDPFTPLTDQVGPWVYGGEQNGKPIPGGCIANSPVEATEAKFRGKYVKFVSTNGAEAAEAAANAGFGDIYLACLANIVATVTKAIDAGARRIFFVGGGFYNSGTLEDSVCAGIGVNTLLNYGFADATTLDDEARMAVFTANAFTNPDHLVRTLSFSQVGLLLAEIGRGTDIDAVVTGSGIEPAVWHRMPTTIIRHTRIHGVGFFVPFPRSAVLQ